MAGSEQGQEEKQQVLTVFEPYEDKPKGAIAKIASFFSSFSQPTRPQSTLSTHTLRVSDAQRRAGTNSQANSGGPNSVGSLAKSDVHSDAHLGVPPHALDKALRTILKEGVSRSTESFKGTDFKRYWMPDSAVRQCFKCDIKFTVTVRRHHCRLCGQIFCSACCSNSVPGMIVDQPGSVRACESCAKLYFETKQQSALWQDESMVMKALREESEIEENTAPVCDEVSVVVTTGIAVLPSQTSITKSRTGSMLPWDTSPTTSSSNLLPMNSLPRELSMGGFSSEKEEKALAIDRLGIQDIFIALMSPSTGLPLQSHRKWLKTYQRSFQANEIVSWLVERNFAAARSEAVMLCQALVDCKMLEVVNSFDQEFKDDANTIITPLQLQSVEVGVGEEALSVEDSWPHYWRDSISKHTGSSPEGQQAAFLSTPARSGGNRGLRVPHNTPRNLLTSTKSLPVGLRLSQPKEEAGGGVDTVRSVDFISSEVPKSVTSEEGREFVDSVNLSLKSVNTALESFASKTEQTLPEHPAADVDPHHQSSKLENSSSEQASNRRTSNQDDTFVPSSDWESRSRQTLFELERSAEMHWEYFIRHLLRQEGLDQTWYDIIKPLAVEASHNVQPYSFPQGQMDILKYIKFKKVPGGDKVDSSLFYGEVFTKTVPYKHMLTKIDSPSIMLFKCALEVHRLPNALTSLEALILQEEEYMRNWVNRIKVFQPNIILVEESITGIALNMLLDAGITVVPNVKESVMLRLAHCTEAEPIESLKGISLGVKCGFCKQFYIKSYTLPNGKKKNLMFFDECKPSLACSIVLRGGTLQELRKVKKLVRFAIFAAYSSILECRYLWNEFVQPISPHPSLYQGLQIEAGDDVNCEEQKEYVILYPCAPVYSLPQTQQNSHSEETDGLFHSKVASDKLKRSLDMPEHDSFSSSLFPAPQQPRESLVFVSSGSESGTCTPLQVEKTAQHVFIEALFGSLITFSPGVMYTLPYVIQNGVDHGYIGEYLQGKYFWSQKFLSNSSKSGAVILKKKPSLGPGRFTGDSLALQNTTQSLSPLHMPSAALCPDDRPTAVDQRSLSVVSQRPSYTSVTTHPFLSTVLNTAHGKDLKAMLADFRARAGLEGEPQQFFFPSIAGSPHCTRPLSASSPHLKAHQTLHKSIETQRNMASVADDSNSKQVQASSQISEGASVRNTMKSKPRRLPVKRKLNRGMDYAEENLHSVRNAFRRLPIVVQDCSMLAQASPPSRADLTELTEENTVCTGDVSSKFDCMDPYNHQNIALHYSTTCPESPKYPQYCSAPRNLVLHYYSQNDITLGDFLYRFCFSDAACSFCKLSFQSHQLHIAHGNHVINISMEKLEMAPTTEIQLIYTWHKCKECGQVTPSNMLSSPALALSFAKLLELKFYGRDYIPRSTVSDGQPGSCVHSLHHSHVQYFGYQKFHAEFDLQVVNVFAVLIPSIMVKVVRGHIWEGLNWETDLGQLSGRIKLLFESVKDKLEEMNVDPHAAEVAKLLLACDDEHAGLCRKLVGLQNLIAQGGLSKAYASVQLDLEETQVAGYIAQLQDGVVEIKRKVLRAAAHWNKICERLHASIVEAVHPKYALKLSKLAVETEPGDFVPQDTDVVVPESTLSGGIATVFGKTTVTDSQTVDQDKAQTFGLSTASIGTLAGPSDQPCSGAPDPSVTLDREPAPPTLAYQQPVSNDPAGQMEPTLRQDEGAVPPERVLSDGTTATLRDCPDCSEPIPGRSQTLPANLREGDGLGAKVHKKEHRSKPLAKTDMSFDETHFGIRSAKKERVLERNTFFNKHKYQPIPSPFSASEHYLLEMEMKIPVGVFESEPSSIIACALSCRRYRSEMELRRDTWVPPAGGVANGQDGKSQSAPVYTHPPTSHGGLASEQLSELGSTDTHGSKSSLSPHIQLEFGNSYIFFVCRVFFAKRFEGLRKLLYEPGEESYIRSLLRCVHWRARGGKSGSAFCKVVDDRFVLKLIKKPEAQSFCEIGDDYLQYVESAYHQKRPTCLAKIFGVYHVKFSNSRTSQSLEGTFLVMENLRYAHPCNQVFDLKGSMRNRFVRTDDSELDNVYQDENFLQYIQTAPLYIHGHSKKILMDALKMDTEFLAQKNIMDYSLLAGVSESSQQIVVGIIDYLRAFTWDKKLEAWIKRDLLVAGSKGHLPTIVSPDLYRRRFLDAMERYFALIPDKWHNLFDY
nr:1-phosphatidylinositol-3-phosphate 5-kinase [Halisarca dujardinii]